MNEIIQNWIDLLNQGTEVLLTGFSEIFENFPAADFTYTFPQGVLSLANLKLESIDIVYFENSQVIKEITFTVTTPNTWGIVNGYYNITNLEFSITVVEPEGESPVALRLILGNLSLENNLPDIHVSIMEDPESSDPSASDWIIKHIADDNVGTIISFDLLKQILQTPKLEEGIPPYFGTFDQVSIDELVLTFPFAMDSLKEVSISIDYGSWQLLEVQILITGRMHGGCQ